MKYIKQIKRPDGIRYWDLSYYYDEIVPELLKRREDLGDLLSSDLNGIANREKTLNSGVIKTICYDLENDKVSLTIDQRQGKESIEIIYSGIVNFNINCCILPITIMAHEIDVTPDNDVVHSLFLLGDTAMDFKCKNIALTYKPIE
ncbi:MULTISPECIES: hypothetical protein [unclassified Psychrobacter]|uniref:hypothetical protein n=1 Tax=unclassified Psychrobacter TaxID=196806 RepID=UPI0018F37873|nr:MULTISPECIES: hypothetical protein [unclassified Psychrobacter]